LPKAADLSFPGSTTLKLVSQTVVAPSPEEIEALTLRSSDPLIARVAAKLLASASRESEDPICARIALRELHAACREI
jgi:hypothetical protein